MGAKIGVLLNCGQQSQFSKVRREFDAGRVNLDPPMTCADWPVPGNLTLLHPQTAYTRKPLHRYELSVIVRHSSRVKPCVGPVDFFVWALCFLSARKDIDSKYKELCNCCADLIRIQGLTVGLLPVSPTIGE